MTYEGFYSIVRYSSDPLRGESKNVAVVLIDETRGLASSRTAPLSQITPRLTEHGILDGLLMHLAARLDGGELRQPGDVAALAESLGPTISITRPVPAAIDQNFDVTLKALYKSLVAPRRGRNPGLARGEILDRLVRACRDAGVSVSPGIYVEDLLFDAVVSTTRVRQPVQVLSFETEAENPHSIEVAAGHFLFALHRLHSDGVCVIQPPHTRAKESARVSHRRVARWMADQGVATLRPDELRNFATLLAGAEPLALVTA